MDGGRRLARPVIPLQTWKFVRLGTWRSWLLAIWHRRSSEDTTLPVCLQHKFEMEGTSEEKGKSKRISKNIAGFRIAICLSRQPIMKLHLLTLGA